MTTWMLDTNVASLIIKGDLRAACEARGVTLAPLGRERSRGAASMAPVPVFVKRPARNPVTSLFRPCDQPTALC
jgi:hypothetical protein